MDFKNIVTCQTWTDKEGNQKKKWLNCGTLKTLDDGRQFIQMNSQPETTFFVFEQKEKASAKEQPGMEWDQ